MRPKPAKPTEPLHALTSEELKARLDAAAAELVAEVEAWHQTHPDATLSDVEAELLKVRQRVSEQMGAALLEAHPSRRPQEKPACPECGRRMRFKDGQETSVQTQVGVIRYRRGYYYCPRCHSGLFPPGSPPAASAGGL
jgi:hypothetical protein